MRRRFGDVAISAALGAGVVLALAGCFGAAGGASDAPTGTASPTPSDSPTSEPAAPPTLRPELSAEENLAYFDQVNTAVVAANPAALGRDFIDALTAAGFDKTRMQVTRDTTTLDTPADSVQFAVAFQGACLVGQYGPASGGYHGAVRPELGTGGCLIGQTRPIDW